MWVMATIRVLALRSFSNSSIRKVREPSTASTADSIGLASLSGNFKRRCEIGHDYPVSPGARTTETKGSPGPSHLTENPSRSPSATPFATPEEHPAGYRAFVIERPQTIRKSEDVSGSREETTTISFSTFGPVPSGS